MIKISEKTRGNGGKKFGVRRFSKRKGGRLGFECGNNKARQNKRRGSVKTAESTEGELERRRAV